MSILYFDKSLFNHTSLQIPIQSVPQYTRSAFPFYADLKQTKEMIVLEQAPSKLLAVLTEHSLVCVCSLNLKLELSLNWGPHSDICLENTLKKKKTCDMRILFKLKASDRVH